MPEVEKISISGASIDIVDKKVVQTPTTTNANYEVLFSKSANDTEETDGVRKTEGYIFNPNSTNMKLLGEYNTFSATPTKLELYNSTYKHSEITPGQLKLTDGTNVGSDSVLTLKAEELSADITNSSTWDGTNTSLKTAVTGLSSSLAQKVINESVNNDLKMKIGTINTSSSLTFTAQIAFLVTFGTGGQQGIYGCRSGTIQDIITAGSSISHSVSGTTYTFNNTSASVGARYLLAYI